MQIIRYASLKAAQWTNGGGMTRQIAAGPSDATGTNWDWRISIARRQAARCGCICRKITCTYLMVKQDNAYE